ncbi:hypothetical protein LOK49_LG11G00895 [Camellia lanceoleosa]|uniref:Uncharacterized protein n=1 Tax=Camellia lanceoleosa TaxID=1840588 RepID=A0ACC0G6I2_9ERIC|nr:hypothetical protein LOK49_LG11G00895 [Camellia lanceoleosa]
MGSALLAIELGFMGPNYSISTACATSNYCFYAAANHIRRGEDDLTIAGGTEAMIIPIGLGSFIACRALSQRNDDPQTASRPWDKDRDGFVMDEGASVLVIESLEHAMKGVLPSISPVAPMGYEQRAESGSGLGMLSSGSLYEYGSLSMGDNGYRSLSSYSSKTFGVVTNLLLLPLIILSSCSWNSQKCYRLEVCC